MVVLVPGLSLARPWLFWLPCGGTRTDAGACLLFQLNATPETGSSIKKDLLSVLEATGGTGSVEGLRCVVGAWAVQEVERDWVGLQNSLQRLALPSCGAEPPVTQEPPPRPAS